MKMKISKRLLGGLVGILLSSCSLLKDPSVIVTYPGEFFVSLYNVCGDTGPAWGCFGKGSRTLTETDFGSALGKLEDLEVEAIKILNKELSNDYGDLTATIMEGWETVAEKTAPIEVDRVRIKYSF